MLLKTKTVTVVQIQHRETGLAARKLRQDAGISLRRMAKLLGISAMYLSDLERGNRKWFGALVERFEEIIKTERR